MSLLSFSNIAGPSRLPLQVTVTACRRAVAARFYATEAQEPQEPLAAEQSEQSAPVDELSALTLDPSTPATRSGLEKREGRIFYRDWLRYEGEQFRVPQKGQKAKWLGGNVVRMLFWLLQRNRTDWYHSLTPATLLSDLLHHSPIISKIKSSPIFSEDSLSPNSLSSTTSAKLEWKQSRN